MAVLVWAATRHNHTRAALHTFGVLRRCNRRAFSSSSRWKIENHYETLNVSRDATTDEIKDAYYKLMKIHHPDVPTSSKMGSAVDTARSTAINVAWAVLKSKKEREEYDEKLSHEIDREKRKQAAAAAAAARNSNQEKGEVQKAKTGQAAKSSTDVSSTDKPSKKKGFQFANRNSQEEFQRAKAGQAAKSSTNASSVEKSSTKKGFQFARSTYHEPPITRPRPTMPPRPPRPPPKPTPWTMPKHVVTGQPPTHTELRQRKRRQELEASNRSDSLFQDGDDPCKGLGAWTIPDAANGSDSPNFWPFPGIPQSVWRPAYERADQLLANRKRLKLEALNKSHKLFPRGDDPCKGLGAWTIPDADNGSNPPHFSPFPRIPQSVWRPAYERADQLLANRKRLKLEALNISRELFPHGDDPCKGLGIWTIPDPNQPNSELFTPFAEIPKSVSDPAFEIAKLRLLDKAKLKQERNNLDKRLNLERDDASHHLSLEGTEPLKDYGLWNYLSSMVRLSPRGPQRKDKDEGE